MTDTLEAFFRAQQRRIRRHLETRCGRLDGCEDAPQHVDRRTLHVESRGHTGHASGRRKPHMDDQGGTSRFIAGKRHSVTWSNLERKAGRLPAFTQEPVDGPGDDD